ncbi:hypothetical protein PMAYCL1PPCAC_04890, partial [Pristionchus mayeri]
QNLVNGVAYMIVYQLSSFQFVHSIYQSIQEHNLVKGLSIAHVFFMEVSLHSALFVALHRVKRFTTWRDIGSEAAFFHASILITMVLSLPKICDFCIFTTLSFKEFNFGNGPELMPNRLVTNETLNVLSDIKSNAVSIITLCVNSILVVLIRRERKLISEPLNGRLSVERRLVITSVVSYLFYMFYFINNALARYAKIRFCGYAQWMFLGIASITPFWCLIIFTPTIRRAVFKFRTTTVEISSVQTKT